MRAARCGWAPMGDPVGPGAVPAGRLGSLSWGSGAGAGRVRAGCRQGAGRARQDGSDPAGCTGPRGHGSRRGQHHAAGSTSPNPQTWHLGPLCKCKGSRGPACTSISPHGPRAAHVETGIPPDLLLRGGPSSSPPSPLRRVAGLPVSTGLSVTCLSRM